MASASCCAFLTRQLCRVVDTFLVTLIFVIFASREHMPVHFNDDTTNLCHYVLPLPNIGALCNKARKWFCFRITQKSQAKNPLVNFE